MLRRLNYTKRLRIRRSDVRISVTAQEGNITFLADLSRLADYPLPPAAAVFVEAYRQTSWMRFDFGSVGALDSAQPRRLVEFDGREGIRFRVKVTSEADDKMLLAEADGIPLRLPDKHEEHRDPLLPIMSRDLADGEVHRLDYSGSEPLLLLNSKAGYYRDIAHSPAFVSLVYPAVLREVLTRCIVIEKHDDDVSGDDWQSRWLRFATTLPGMTQCPPEESDESDKFAWIDMAVAAFARKVGALQKFHDYWREAE